MVFVEPAFPRGKIQPEPGEKVRERKKKAPQEQYGAASMQDEKARRLRPKQRHRLMQDDNENDDEEVQQSATSAPMLSMNLIQEGMLVLGCVRRVVRTNLDITLPGRLRGIVPIIAISDAYSKRLQSMIDAQSMGDCPMLEQLYKEGDLVYVKVFRKQKQHPQLLLSLKPTDLHSELTASQLVPGLMLSSTVLVKEDHGYTMDTGVRNVRAFLPYKNVNKNPTDIGRNIMCLIESVKETGTGATVLLKACHPEEPRQLDVEDATIETIMPGCQVTFSVGEPVKYGLQGMIFDDTVPAFVNTYMLDKVTSTPEKYTMFQQLPATLLYVLPLTNQVFVSLVPYANNRAVMPENPIPIGSIIERAFVKNVDNMGVWMQQGKQQRILLPRSTILRQQADELGNFEESTVMAKYMPRQHYRVRVVHYDPLERTYIVTDDVENCAAERIQSMDDVIIGQTYKCLVRTVNDNGVLVALDNVKGSVSRAFLDRNVPLKKGEKVMLRAVCYQTGEPYVLFTNHPQLLDESVSILSSWDQLESSDLHSQSYHGVVNKITPAYFMISFFNNMHGILFRNIAHVQQDMKKMGKLQQGVVEKFHLRRFNRMENRLELYLPVSFETDEAMQVQQVEQVTVSCIHATGVEVQTEADETGTIALECFSEFGEHNPLYVRLLREGERLAAIKLGPGGNFSVRCASYFQQHQSSVANVRVGNLLKASCFTVNDKLYARLLLRGNTDPVEVQMENDSMVAMEEGSIIMVRVSDICKPTAKSSAWRLKVSTDLKDVCLKGVQDVRNFTATYLEDVETLLQRYRDRKKFPFASYTLGQEVVCTIESIVPDSNKMAVEVCGTEPSAVVAKGIALTVLSESSSGYSVGTKVPGRVVWLDVERKLVHVCVDEPLFKRIQPADGKKKKIVANDNDSDCWVLFSNRYVHVCCQKNGPSSSLVIVPAKHHYNDLTMLQLTGNSIILQHVEPLKKLIFGLDKESYERYSSYAIANFLDQAEDQNEGNDDNDTSKGDENSMDNSSSNIKDYDPASETPSKKVTKRKNDTDTREGKIVTKKLKKDKTDQKQKKSDKILPPAKLSMEQSSDPKLKKKKNASVNMKEGEVVAKKDKKKKKQANSTLTVSNTPAPVEKKKKQKKEKNPPFLIDQLDGATDIVFIPQLDGTEDQQSSGKKSGAVKRKHTNAGESSGLPGATNFWDSTPVYKRAAVDSSDDDASDSDEEGKKETDVKKRTTAKERFEAMKQEEQRLRKIEEELANPSLDPHTPDQFDRLLLAQPNNSMLWIRYMVFHMESAELEKARAVGRKALKAINFREEAERLNVWIALLNLELRYETVDSFKQVLLEAIQYNDAYKVYERSLDILIDCEKHAEVREILDLLLRKFRKQTEMWFLVADAWYRIGQGNKVKPLLSQALKSLPTRDHIPLIVKFAFLHNRNGNRDEAHLLFEQILTSYPKRTDIWSQYVDMLVKDNLVENARQILERAIMQRLPMKNMKTLYTKFVNFEEKHGDRDSVRRVKQMAADYVQAQLNNAGVKGGE
uniref:S1 motif domain-containing protein n=1 Tax=Anopheles farauti TaxID=69004 RepID=A0A182Q0X7_9DIPT